MSSLDFVARWDIEAFKAKCSDQREVAKRWPAYDRRMGLCEEYGWQLGPWLLTFCLEVWRPQAVWHGSAAVTEEIWQTVIGKTATRGPISKPIKYEVPVRALLDSKDWILEHKEQARFILAEVFGDILRPGDAHQPATEIMGPWTMHWYIPHDGPKFWQKNLH